MKYALRDPIFGMHTHVISLTYTGYGILTLKLIRGQQRSLEVKMRSNLKNAPRDPIVCKHTHMISPINIGYDILTTEVIRGHWRS